MRRQRRPRSPLQKFVLASAAVLSLGVGYWWGQQYAEPPRELSVTLFSQPRELASFALVDKNGEPFTEQSLRGQWDVVFFGYTHCPDSCPMTLTRLVQVHNRLAAEPQVQQAVRMVLVSVDPARDVADELKPYVEFFNPEFMAATGDDAELDTVVRQFDAVYRRLEADADGNYLVDHSSALALVDPEGRFAGVFTGEVDPITLAADLQQIVSADEH